MANLEPLYTELIQEAEALQLYFLEELQGIAETLIDDPDEVINETVLFASYGVAVTTYLQFVNEWSLNELVTAYESGINAVNTQIVEHNIPINESQIGQQLFSTGGAPGSLPNDVLEDWQQHRDLFSVMQRSTLEDFGKMRQPILSTLSDDIREITIEASQQAFREADTLTRRDLMQNIMHSFSNRGITAVRYRNGANVNIRSYSELTARTHIHNAARQGAINRQMQIGQDLVRMDVHFPTCQFCAPWQGGIYSITGRSDQYESLATVRRSGAFHINCSHGVTPYYEGISGELSQQKELTQQQNEQRYDVQRRQRAIERHIRKWRRRDATAVDPLVRQKSGEKIDFWMNELRELVDNNDFLRFKYERIAIGEV